MLDASSIALIPEVICELGKSRLKIMDASFPPVSRRKASLGAGGQIQQLHHSDLL